MRRVKANSERSEVYWDIHELRTGGRLTKYQAKLGRCPAFFARGFVVQVPQTGVCNPAWGYAKGMNAKTYRIGEAAALLNLKTYVLRFWEMEFPQIAPDRTEKGQRLYSEKDVAVLRRIRYLLHERGLTIEGARRILREEEAKGGLAADAEPDITSIVAGDGESDFPINASSHAIPGAIPGGNAAAPGAAGAAGAPHPLSPELMREVASELAALRELLKP